MANLNMATVQVADDKPMHWNINIGFKSKYKSFIRRTNKEIVIKI
jgi:hypothetical protein